MFDYLKRKKFILGQISPPTLLYLNFIKVLTKKEDPPSFMGFDKFPKTTPAITPPLKLRRGRVHINESWHIKIFEINASTSIIVKK